jgi:hypothetical protein
VSSEKLTSAITAIKSGDKATGSRLLMELLKGEPSNESAWLWLATCMDDVCKKIYCLKKSLSINPNNQVVKTALERLEQSPQPAIEDIVPMVAEKSPGNPTPPEEKSKITAPLKNPALPSVKKSQNVKAIKKTPANKYKKYTAILGGSLIVILCGICLLGVLIFGTDKSGISNQVNSSSTLFNESDALQVVQNWKAPSNKGMTCKEMLDAIAYVYRHDLGISDATVKWGVTKQSNTLFIVQADLKGETGWATFSWQVKFPEQKIISLGDINLCKSVDITPILNDVSTSESPQPQAAIVATPNDINEICFPPSIPGISFEDITNYLVNLGITCTPMINGSNGYSSNCEGVSTDSKANIYVDIYSGNQPDDIYLILSSITQLSNNSSDEISANILGNIAKIPYTNSNPEQAQLWVENNISSYTPDSLVQDQPVEYFGDVRYHMSCASKALRCLAIGQGSGSGWDYDCNNLVINTAIPENNSVVATDMPILIQEPTVDPTLIPAPIVKTGSGNSIVNIEKLDGPALIHIKGNPSSSGLFSVTNDDGLFLAISDKGYDGVKMLDFFPDHTTKSFEIEAGGEWTIEIYPLQGEFFENRNLDTPGQYQSNNDDVLFIEEGKNRIKVEGNSASTNFAVWTHGESYLLNQDLIVNVTEPYKGTIDLPDWVRILEVEAVGPWSIEISKR